MSYPGGKSGEGVYQRIINEMPPHDIYAEPFAGAAAILRHKRPARASIAVDVDPGVCEALRKEIDKKAFGELRIFCADGVRLIEKRHWKKTDLIYCDPPYLFSVRRDPRRIYTHEFGTEDEHIRLLSVLWRTPAMVCLSGYPNAIYDGVLKGWRKIEFQASTRGGAATECLWMNYPEPLALHDYRYIGENYRERERIKKKKARWISRLCRIDRLERLALLDALQLLGDMETR